MLKTKLAGVVVAGLLLGAGAVNAAESAFPAGTNETAATPHKYQADDRVRAPGTFTGSIVPASQNETASAPHAYQRDVRPGRTDANSRSSGSVFPASYSEVA